MEVRRAAPGVGAERFKKIGIHQPGKRFRTRVNRGFNTSPDFSHGPKSIDSNTRTIYEMACWYGTPAVGAERSEHGHNQAGQVPVCPLQAGASVAQLGGAEMQKSFSFREVVRVRIVSWLRVSFDEFVAMGSSVE